MNELTINTWEDLQKYASKIIASLNKDDNLKIAAATNPFLALEELGYKINFDVIGHIEDKMRFSTKTVAHLSKLRESIYQIAGKKFNIRYKDELNSVLFDELKIEAFDNKGCLVRQEIRIRQKGDTGDDLMPYVGLHPIIEPLLAFREIDASVSGFGDKNIYQRIRNGGYGQKSNIKLTIKLKKDKK